MFVFLIKMKPDTNQSLFSDLTSPESPLRFNLKTDTSGSAQDLVFSDCSQFKQRRHAKGPLLVPYKYFNAFNQSLLQPYPDMEPQAIQAQTGFKIKAGAIGILITLTIVFLTIYFTSGGAEDTVTAAFGKSCKQIEDKSTCAKNLEVFGQNFLAFESQTLRQPTCRT